MQTKKKQLIETLGTFDERAKLDDDLIKRYKTEIYGRQIYLTERVETWNDQLFEPKTFNMEFLRHPALNDNALFKQIKQVFDNYNDQVLGVQPKINQQHIKFKKMVELMKVMINIIEIDNKPSQQLSLKKAHTWMKQNLKNTPDKYQSVKNNTKTPSPKRKIQLPKIPSNQMQEEAKDFKNKNRTLHKFMYAPQDRLKYYKRRQLNFENSLKIIPNKSQQNISKIKYIKPQFDLDFGIQQQPLQQVNQENPLPGQGVETGIAIDDIPPIQQNVLQFGDQGGQDEQQQPQLPQQDQKIGKLDPRTKNYTFPDDPDYQKSQTILKQHFELMKSKQQRQLKQDQQDQMSICKYVERKSRFNNQLSRKLESLKQMTKIAKIQLKTKQKISKQTTTFPIIDLSQLVTQTSIPQAPLQQTSGYQYLSQVKRNVHNSINLGEGKTEMFDEKQGLSIYGKKKTDQDRKWLSLILKSNQSKQQQQQYLNELQDIKTRLCQNRIPFEMKKIYQGMLKPTELSKQQILALGHPGGSLLSNPDFKVGKKKKKKKRK